MKPTFIWIIWEVLEVIFNDGQKLVVSNKKKYMCCQNYIVSKWEICLTGLHLFRYFLSLRDWSSNIEGGIGSIYVDQVCFAFSVFRFALFLARPHDSSKLTAVIGPGRK